VAFFLEGPEIMFKTLLKVSLLTVLAGSGGAAQSNPTAPPNPHREYDQRFSACKWSADQQKLSGDARKAFIARCVKNRNDPVITPPQ
jgi:hypothetical protein